MSETGIKLVMEFAHHINTDAATLYRNIERPGNTLNQIGQVMDELLAEKDAALAEALESLAEAHDYMKDADGFCYKTAIGHRPQDEATLCFICGAMDDQAHDDVCWAGALKRHLDEGREKILAALARLRPNKEEK